MEQRQLGRTGLKVSVLSFGCGAVGGLMTRGEPRDQERAVARALELGINYFDTAALYGNGTSETNLGRVLAKLKPSRHRRHQGARRAGRSRPHRRGGGGFARGEPQAARPRQRRHLPLPQHHRRGRRWRDDRPRRHAQRGAAGLRAPAQGGQDAPHRHHGLGGHAAAARASPTPAPSRPRRSASTRSIPRPARRFPPAIRRRTTKA